jgi:endo-1,4-beta-xylanase
MNLLCNNGFCVLLSFLLVTIFVSVPMHGQTTLKEAFKKDFLIGAALNRAQFTEEDSRGAGIVKAQFNTISPENVLKWESVHPEPGRYDFSAADRYVEFGEKNGMFIIGHTLVWHNQTPKWVFEDANGKPVKREVLLERLRDHIHSVVGRYKGRIKGWDVVNEALNDSDGSMRQTAWYRIIGDDYIAKAFQFAREADPKAELYYNDYSLENETKRNGAVELIKKLLAQKIPVKAVGLQGHNKMEWPTLDQQEATIKAFADLGVKVMITELDIEMLPRDLQNNSAEVTVNIASNPRLNPYPSGLPTEMLEAQAKRYANLFKIFLKHRDVITRVTFWGVTDRDSWLNNWPIRGRTNYPLLFDRGGKPKPAFQAVIRAPSSR